MTDEFIEMKKAKGTKKCVIKKMLKFEDYKKCLFDNEPMLKSQQRFKSENHEVYTENINKIALSSNDDKRIVASGRITSYPYGYCGEDSYKYLDQISKKKIIKGLVGITRAN